MDFEIWMFLAGLGIFLFGMHMMEESIRLLSGGAFRALIRRYTGTRLKAILSGTFSTAILQSSSAVSLMVLAFVGAGIMSLTQAVAVMMGTKIGTTATAWIVAIFGFKFNIDAFSLPLIGIGGLGMIVLAKSVRYVNISKFLVAFGFLFMGLDYMKGSVDQISEAIDPAMFAGYGVLIFALVGLAMTAIMQSSSATIAIVLTMLYSGVVEFQGAAAMVIGANVGTTVTVLLGSIGELIAKKQAAISQLMFTVSTAVVTLLFLTPLTWVVLDLIGFRSNLVLGLALFHSIFNVIGVLMFYPFIDRVAAIAMRIIPETESDMSKYMHKTDPAVTDAGMEAFRREIIRQLRYSMEYIKQIVLPGAVEKPVTYGELERYHAEIFEYYTKLASVRMDEPHTLKADQLLRASRNIMNATRNLFEIRDELAILKNEIDPEHQKAYGSMVERFRRSFETGNKMGPKLKETEGLAEEIEALRIYIDQKDRDFIQMCSAIITSGKFKKAEVTFLLMINRMVTQSNRMLLFAMRELLERMDYLKQNEVKN